MKKIFLSEPGLICCAGRNKEELYNSCITGNRNGIIFREHTSGNKYPAGMIKDECLSTVDHDKPFSIDTKIMRVIDAALEQIRPNVEKAIKKYGVESVGMCLGSCDNGAEGSLIAHREFFNTGKFPKEYSLDFQKACFPAVYAASKFGLKGPVFTIATACASGASAIIKGSELIRAGFCSAVLCGGVDMVSETVFIGFNALEAMSDDFTNPLSKNRKGLNLGEGAAFFLLDSEDGDIELLGSGESADAHHITAPGPDGAGPAKAMKTAISEANISPSQIGYINLHGTGTPLNDKAESFALNTVFGNQIPPVSSTKPVTGHTLGAAGALEAAICWMVIKEKKGLPVHLWDGVADDGFPLLPVVSLSEDGNPIPVDISVCMTNSFAFGGCNVSLILGNRS